VRSALEFRSFLNFLGHIEQIMRGMAVLGPNPETAKPWISSGARKLGLPVRDDASGDDERKRYLNGPLPLSWLEAAARLPGRSLHVGMVLWYAAGLSGSAEVHLSNTLCLRFGLDRNAKYRALRALGDARLVMVRNKRGRSPLVTLLDGCN